MNVSDDLYTILGVDKTATEDEIKRAYRKKAQETHPDLTSSDQEDFINVNKAYKILSDKKLRLKYDKTGSTDQASEANFKSSAMREIQRILLYFLEENENEDIFYIDLPSRVLLLINNNIAKNKKVISDHKKKITRLRRYKKRFKHVSKDTASEDFISFGFESQIYNLKTEINLEVEKIRQFEYMLKLLADYKYEPEVRPKTFGILNPSIGETI
jgi:curved DNA-binding protein CbpA